MNVQEINERFKNGYIHDSLFYTIEKGVMQIDPRKISYTSYYQSYDFYILLAVFAYLLVRDYKN